MNDCDNDSVLWYLIFNSKLYKCCPIINHSFCLINGWYISKEYGQCFPYIYRPLVLYITFNHKKIDIWKDLSLINYYMFLWTGGSSFSANRVFSRPVVSLSITTHCSHDPILERKSFCMLLTSYLS